MMKKVFFALLITATPVLAQAKPVTLDSFHSDSSSSSDDCGRCCPGPQGPIGPTGPQGFQGPKGDQGEPGEPGRPGARGPRGKEGCRGPRGHRGPRGRRGCQGDPGATGATGAPGITGATGATAPALSAAEFLNVPAAGVTLTIFPAGAIIPLTLGPISSPNITGVLGGILVDNSDAVAHTYSIEYTVSGVSIGAIFSLQQDATTLPTSVQGGLVAGTEVVGQALFTVPAGGLSTIALQNSSLISVSISPLLGSTGITPVLASAVVTQVN